MKLFRQVSAIFNFGQEVEEVEEIVLVRASECAARGIVMPPPGTRRRSLPTKLPDDIDIEAIAAKARQQRSQTHQQKKRQQVITKFVRQGSFLKKSFEATTRQQKQQPQLPLGLRKITVEANPEEPRSAPLRAPPSPPRPQQPQPQLPLSLPQPQQQQQQAAGLLDKKLEEKPKKKLSAESSSVDSTQTASTVDASDRSDMDLSLSDHCSTSTGPAALGAAPPPPRLLKTISWDASVEQDLQRRALTSKLRRKNPLPEAFRRQMAHRVHLCNQRNAEFKEFHKDYLAGKQEIRVAPVQEDWLKRCDGDISDKFLVMEVDLFGTGSKNKIRVNQKKIKHVRQASF